MSSNLMEKLAVSKKIMEKHNGTPRAQGGSLPMADNSNASYNIPQDMLQQPPQQQQQQIYLHLQCQMSLSLKTQLKILNYLTQ